MSKFQQRHYQVIADAINEVHSKYGVKHGETISIGFDALCIVLASTFKEDNKKFKPHLFYAASGNMYLWAMHKPAPKTTKAKRSN